MPILEAEARTFPATLFSDPTTATPPDARWWVLYTRARMEKSVARRLRAREVPFYLPLYRHTWVTGGRARTSYLPLFPGYVFLFGDDGGRGVALETNMLSATLPVSDQERLFNDLARVERVLGGPAPVAPESALAAGTPVAVVTGPFQGLCGTVVRRGGAARLVIEVELLRRGVSIDIEEWAVRPLPASAP